MFIDYLSKQVPIRHLWYFQRVGESAVQYGERLLAGKNLGVNNSPEGVAKNLVNNYKDHDFVNDFDEAKNLLGDHIVKHGTVEYKFSDELYKFFDLLEFVLGKQAKEMWCVGSIEDGFTVRPKRTENE